MNSFKGLFQGCLRTTPNGCFSKGEQLQMDVSAKKFYRKTFLSKTTSVNWDLISKSFKSFLVLPSFETTVEYICNLFKDAHREKAPSNKTSNLTKSMNMDILVIAT